MVKNTGDYRCAECGWRSLKWVGRCGGCGQWSTLEQVAVAKSAGLRSGGATTPTTPALPVTELKAALTAYLPTGIAELDRVLGGGCVPGVAILFSGEPGVGKSTLLLQAAAKVAAQGARVLYVSGEESTGQIKMRAERTGAVEETLYLASDTDLGAVLGHIEAVDPDFLIVDSVQTIAAPEIDGIVGGPAQVREVASTLVRAAKSRNMPLMLVGHVTKEGNVAGPRTLEHLVDVVCHFEGDRQSALRFLRTLKNRFGPTDEVGCFEMVQEGIAEVADPSRLFLSSGDEPVSGTCVVMAVEGRRVLPVEVQALVAPTSTPNPRRVTSGVDAARVAMILAVLERRAGVRLHDADVYVSTVGGVRLVEPGADLAIALAIISAAKNKPLPRALAVAGELTLAGEVRSVVAGAQRQKEAKRLGYERYLNDSVKSLKRASEIAFNA
ncbi:DNA repair protein RadA [Canibacter zhoujuaniae]|uniref:DNA repair protein RadA n=1 Tax=Canibacter zhoujuaniae TaxID=2708343 RepID=UPI0014209346|nr:DNA repair protein RadA [Canibacter zhoujuaniae]